MKLNEAEINKFMPKGWVMVPTCNGTGTIFDCMDGDGPAYEREMHRAAFTIHASYKRIVELEQQAKDLQEALDDKVRVTREISDLIDPVAAGGATNPALIDVQAQLQRDLPLMIRLIDERFVSDLPAEVAHNMVERYRHLLKG